jgi:hypothetical protein
MQTTGIAHNPRRRKRETRNATNAGNVPQPIDDHPCAADEQHDAKHVCAGHEPARHGYRCAKEADWRLLHPMVCAGNHYASAG